mgnify:CR=1 FL=1
MPVCAVCDTPARVIYWRYYLHGEETALTNGTKARSTLRRLCLAGIIAALYAALTLAFSPISFGAVQFRISEALTLLPVLFPEAIPGLALGCLVSNLLGGVMPWDPIFGTLATLLAAALSWRLRKSALLAALPPVVCNAVIVGGMLHFILPDCALLPTMLTVGAGEAVVCYGLGVPLLMGLKRAHLPRL